jgi:hypothetical protein
MVGDVPTSLPTSRPPRRGAYFVQIEAIAVGTNAVLFGLDADGYVWWSVLGSVMSPWARCEAPEGGA